MTTALTANDGLHPRFSVKSVLSALAVVMLTCGTFIAVMDHRGSAESPTAASTYTSADLQALADVPLPSSFRRVTSTWACVSTAQSLCFTSSSAAPNAVAAIAAAVHANEYTASNLHNRLIPAQYTLCTTVGSTPAGIVVSPRASNAVEKDGTWIVPPGQTPQFAGSVVTVFLTGPNHCP